MSRIIFTLMSLMLASCTPEPSSNNDSVSLSVDTPSLEFDAEGGEKTFVVTSLKTFYMLEDESWITTQKGTKNMEHQSVMFSKNYGMAGAISVILFIISAILCLVVYFTLNTDDSSRRKKKKRARAARKEVA